MGTSLNPPEWEGLPADLIPQVVTFEQNAGAARAMTVLCDKETPTREYRDAEDQLTRIMGATLVGDLHSKPAVVTNPLNNNVRGVELTENIALLSILRAGLAPEPELRKYFHSPMLLYVGIKRQAETSQPQLYFESFPNLRVDHCVVIDPLLATGGSAYETIKRVKRWSPKARISFFCFFGTEHGVLRILGSFPDTKIYMGRLCEGLDEHDYVIDACGDGGDRHNGADNSQAKFVVIE